MIITHKLQPMDLTHKQNTIRVDVVQDDKYSRDIEFTLTENGVAWQIPDGATAVVRYKKPDGTGGNYDTLPDGSTAYQISGNVLTVALAPQVCTVQGTVQLSVGLIQGSAEINTFTVNIVVHPNPGATYQSEDYIKLSGAVPNSGWTPNMYLGTDASGNVVAKEGTSGGGGTSSKDGVGIQSVEQTTTSTEDGGTNIVTVTKTDGTSSTFQVKNGSKGSTGPKGTDGKSAYQYAQDGGYTGTESEFAAKMAEEMPDKLPNPNALTFTGAVTGSYDGSAPLSVDIPSGGGSGGATPYYKVANMTTTEEATEILIPLSTEAIAKLNAAEEWVLTVSMDVFGSTNTETALGELTASTYTTWDTNVFFRSMRNVVPTTGVNYAKFVRITSIYRCIDGGCATVFVNKYVQNLDVSDATTKAITAGMKLTTEKLRVKGSINLPIGTTIAFYAVGEKEIVEL